MTILMVLRITHWIWHPKTSCQNQIKIIKDSSILFTFLCHDTHLNSFYLSTSFHSDWNENIFIHQMLSCATANWRESKHNFFFWKKGEKERNEKELNGKDGKETGKEYFVSFKTKQIFFVCTFPERSNKKSLKNWVIFLETLLFPFDCILLLDIHLYQFYFHSGWYQNH